MFSSKPYHQIRIYCVLIVLSAGTSAIYAADSPPAFESEVGSISKLLQQKKLPQAQETLGEFWTEHSKDGDFVEAVRRIKDVYWQQEDHAAHYVLCDRIIKEFPNHTLAVATRADVVRGYIYDKDMAKASQKLEEFWTYGKSDEHFLEYARQIKDLFWEKNERAAHYALCNRIIKEFPDHPLTVTTRADVVRGYIYDNDSNKAAERLEEYMSNPSDSIVFREGIYAVGQAYRWEGKDPAKGREIYERWLSKYSDSPDSYIIQCAVVLTYLEENNSAGANTALERFKQLCAGREDVVSRIHELGDKFADQKDYSTALQIFIDLKKQYPNHERAPWFQRSIVQTYLDLDDRAGVDREVDIFFSQYLDRSGFVEQARQMASDFDKHNETDKVIEIYVNLLQKLPGHDESIRFLAELIKGYMKKGATTQADSLIALLANKYQAHSGYAGIVNDLGDSYREKKEYAKAIDAYQMALATESSDADALAAYTGIARSSIWLRASDAEIDVTVQRLMTDYKDTSGLGQRIFEIAEEYYLRGEEAVQINDVEHANVDYSKAIAIWEKNVSQIDDSYFQCRACYFTAISYQRMKSYEDAIPYYQQVVDTWPDYEKAWYAQYMIAKYYEQQAEQGMAAPDLVRSAYQVISERYPESSAARIATHKLSAL